MMIVFGFNWFFVVVDGISFNDLFWASAFSKGYNGKRAESFFYNFDLLVVCASSVFLEYLLNLVTLYYVTDNGIHCLS